MFRKVLTFLCSAIHSGSPKFILPTIRASSASRESFMSMNFFMRSISVWVGRSQVLDSISCVCRIAMSAVVSAPFWSLAMRILNVLTIQVTKV